MAKKSKSRFTNLVKFVADPEDELNYEEESNNEIRTQVLNTKYDDEYEEYDEYDAYTPDEKIVTPVVEEVIVEEPPIVEEEPVVIEETLPVDEIIEETIVEEVTVVETEQELVDLDELQNKLEDDYDMVKNVTNQKNNRKEDENMRREVPEFIKADKVDVPKAPQVGAQRYQQAQVAEQPNMKESIILGNTTIKGDIITDAGIQIYGAVIGNIESGGCVQLVGKVEGDISGRSVIITNTSLNGNIHADDDVSIKAGCVVTGDVSGTKVVLNGTIRGNIDADGQVDFEAGSVVDGNVAAKSFNIKPGARINGSISTK